MTIHIIKAWSGREADERPLCGSSEFSRTIFVDRPLSPGDALCSTCALEVHKRLNPAEVSHGC